MTRQEFTNITNVMVSEKEFEAINEVYMYSDLDKKDFCNMWCKMNKTRVQIAKVEKMIEERENCYRDTLWRLYEKFQNKISRYGLCQSWEIITEGSLTAYETRAIEYFGIEIDYLMFNTVANVKQFLTK